MKAAAIIVFAVLTGCAVNQDGSATIGVKMSPAWHKTAPRADIEAHYDRMEVHDLCILWADSREKKYIRQEISLSLRRKGLNPLHCY